MNNRRTPRRPANAYARILVVCGYVFLAVGAAFVLGRVCFWGSIVDYVRENLSPDHSIKPVILARFSVLFCLMAGLHFCLGALSIVFYKKRRQLATATILADDVIFPSPFFTLSFTSIAGLYLSCLYMAPLLLIGRRLPVFYEDGLFEVLTAVAFLVSAILLAKAALNVRKNRGLRGHRAVMIWWVVLAASFFFVGMEEISWGQRIFGWSTPETLGKINYQNETNFHNLLNPYLYPIQLVVSFVLTVGLFSFWLLSRKNLSPFLRCVLPHPSLFVLVLLICRSGTNTGDIFEELCAMFVLLYSLRGMNRREAEPAD